MTNPIHAGGPPRMTVDQLRAAVLDGSVDTVIVAFTDMQGRLQGKRLHGHFFLEHVLDHGTEGCNYLLAVDVDMNTVDGYAISSWERGYGDMFFEMDLSTLRRTPGHPASVTIQSDLTWLDGQRRGPAVAALGPQAADRVGRGRRAGPRSPAPSSSSSSSRTPTSPRGTAATTGSPAPTATTSTTRSSAAARSSRSCARSATRCTSRA